MEHFFTYEEEKTALQLLDALQTAYEAAEYLLGMLEKGSTAQFMQTAATLDELLNRIELASVPYHEKMTDIMLPITCRCVRYTLAGVCEKIHSDPAWCAMKLRYELMTALEAAYPEFYLRAYVYTHEEREKRYYEEEVLELGSFRLVNEALETGRFKYDATFFVLAYNHLDYTMQCVENLIQCIPDGLNYELILNDNGSTDGTETYFEEVYRRVPNTKVIRAAVNWGLGGGPTRAVESKYFFHISNDIIILPGAIENMLDCIRSDEKIVWVVPTTPNVSNLQTVPALYKNSDEMREFAKRNNVRDPFRWEQRTRLCNPMDLRNVALTNSRHGLPQLRYYGGSKNQFPDDLLSLRFRRAGYKLILCKDAYCHHFGSVTLKDELQQYNERKFYDEGRGLFERRFGIDPWGTGFCYDPVFLNRVVGEHSGHTEVLGINCGIGSNSLKIKEQIKEYCHNTDCTLSNITDEEKFLEDLRGIGDEATTVKKLKEFKAFLNKRMFDYVVWDDPFLTQYKVSTILDLCKEHLSANGSMFIRRTEQVNRMLKDKPETNKLGENWVIFTNKI